MDLIEVENRINMLEAQVYTLQEREVETMKTILRLAEQLKSLALKTTGI